MSIRLHLPSKYGDPVKVLFSDAQFNDANYDLVGKESQFIRIHFGAVPVSPTGTLDDNDLTDAMRCSRFNEEIRRIERRVQFNVDALVRALCGATERPVSDLACISKLAEGGFNRVLQATFNDGYEVIIRLPYRLTVPKHLATASEAATLDLLRHNGVPVPKVLAYSADESSPVGAEYIMLEKLEGISLSQQWFSMDNKSRAKIMKQIVEVEKKFMTIPFPASGSLFYRKDLGESQLIVPIPGQSNRPEPDQVVLGPTVQHEWWHRERNLLDVDRGPWKTYLACLQAPAKREIAYCQRYGKPRLHVERYLRELHQFKAMSPAFHTRLLSDYLKLAPYLEVPSDHPLARPVLRHPDFSPNNILVNSSNDIVGVIDWQHAVVLPLCLCAGIPDHFQNWGDPISETLAKPETQLPENFEYLDRSEQELIQETMRRRLVHFYYAALTMRQMPDHFDALRDENSMLRAKLFNRAKAPWEGDSQSLRYAIMQVCQNWPMHIGNAGPAQPVDCPVHFSEEETLQCTKDHDQEQEKLQELTEMRDLIGIDAVGWVPDDEHLERARAIAQSMKAGLMEHSKSEHERTALLDHFPFEDHDED